MSADSRSEFRDRGFPPKPDWGERLRDLGLLAALATGAWILAGYPAVAGHDLRPLREVVDQYKFTALLWAAFVFTLKEIDAASPAGGHGPLAVPARVTSWLALTLLMVVGLVGAGIATGIGIALVEGR